MPLADKTLQAIAEKTGVSKMSVSRALGNKPGVSEALRQRILDVARKMGYRPNPLVTAYMASLRSRRGRPSFETGTVLAYLERADLMQEARGEHYLGASAAAEEQGYKLDRFIVGEAGLSPTRLNSILIARNVQGVIIAPLPEGHGQFEHDWSKFCTVVIEYTFTFPSFDRVVHDSYGAMRLIMNRCRSRGFRRVGLVFSQNAWERTEGLNEAAYWIEQKATRDSFVCIPPLRMEGWNDRMVERWLGRHRPEVIVSSNVLASRVRTFLEKNGQHIPKDISLINVNTADQVVSGIRQNNALIGATAIRLLIEKLNRNDRGIPKDPITSVVSGLWVEGETLGWAPDAPDR
ncbi:MAG: LacI family DNA-binding transcriptional regulator [Chthoniobacteraceae bacterium]